MENFSSGSLSMRNDASLAPLGASIPKERLIIDLSDPNLRENALRVLSKSYESFKELAPLLWTSFGTIAVLLQEIVIIYPALSPPSLTLAQSRRVCDVLALFQCVASHPDTRMPFLNASIPQYVYPFLNTKSMLPQFEHLRIASLGVIGALVKDNNKEVVNFLLSTEILPLCLSNQQIGKETSKTVATFIIQKILLDNEGLAHICAKTEIFSAVRQNLDMVLESLRTQNSPRLLRLIIACYSRLSENHRAATVLSTSLPNVFRDETFINFLRGDPRTWNWVQRLFGNIRMNQVHPVPNGVRIHDIAGPSTLSR